MDQNKSIDIRQDEIDLRELFSSLWEGKLVIILTLILSVSVSGIYLRTVDKRYSVTYTLSPVDKERSSPNLGGLGGLASLAGVSIPSSSTNDFLTYKFLIHSEEVANVIIKDKKLLEKIFSNEFDHENDVFRKPPDGILRPYVRFLKLILTGEKSKDYVPPNSSRLTKWMMDSFTISEDRDTGFLTLSSETPNPELMVSVMKRVTVVTDNILKDRITVTSENAIKFYQNQLKNARAREHREALAKLISKEDQKLMLVSRGTYFVAEPLSEPSVSLYPTSPKTSLILALSLVLGVFLGSGIVLIRRALS